MPRSLTANNRATSRRGSALPPRAQVHCHPQPKQSARKQPKDHQKIVAVDLFCGAGGLTSGLMKAGVEVAGGVDLDPAYAYEKNNKAKFRLKTVAEITSAELSGFCK